MISGMNSSPGNDWGRGFQFTPNTNLYVTHVGKRVPGPGTYSYNIRIWNAATQTLVYEQASNPTVPDVYEYAPVTTPIMLNAGTSYILTLYGSGPYYFETNSQVNSNLTYQTMRYCNSCPGFDFPTNSLSGYHYGTPDFLFSLVPPCSSAATISQTVCSSYTSPSGNYTWTTSGTYQDTIPNAGGCDSLITINLSVNQNSINSLTPTVCDTYTSPSGNYIWNTSGLYYDTLPAANGCDSVFVINLVVNNSDSWTDVQEACDSYTWMDGQTYTSSNNTAQVIYTNINGCDSIISLDLTITTINASTNVSGITITAIGNGTYQWIDCGNGNSAIPGATGASFTPTANGNYAVIITNNNCADTSDCVTISSIGLDELQSGNFIVSPNPSEANFTVTCQNAVPSQIEIVDLMGKRVYINEDPGMVTEIDLHTAKAGVYLVLVTQANETFTQRVVLK
jgi:hypothetical protein